MVDTSPPAHQLPPSTHTTTMSDAKIVPFHPQYLPAFIKLNREWIDKYFTAEPMDIQQLESAEQLIISTGGQILFLVNTDPTDTQVRGCVAMVKDGPDNYELAKMCVAPAYHGRHYGDRLMEAAIAWGRQQQAHTITILSNTVLAPAISLYKKHKFVTVKQGEAINDHYTRCNIEMVLDLRGKKDVHSSAIEHQVPEVATI